MSALIAHKLDWTAKTTHNLFIKELGYRFGCVVPQCFGLYPFGAVISCDQDVFVACLGRWRFEWNNKVKAPLLEWF
jgi:hypothetical protein